MSIDFHSQFGNTPKDGDFARYVEELVNGGRPAPGTTGYLLPQPPAAHSGPGPHPAAPPAPPEPGASNALRGGIAKAVGGSLFRQPPAGPAALPATDPGALLALLKRKLGRLLLPLALVWLALGLGLDIPFFASSLPVGMVMLFASFYLNSTRPQK